MHQGSQGPLFFWLFRHTTITQPHTLSVGQDLDQLSTFGGDQHHIRAWPERYESDGRVHVAVRLRRLAPEANPLTLGRLRPGTVLLRCRMKRQGDDVGLDTGIVDKRRARRYVHRYGDIAVRFFDALEGCRLAACRT